MWEVKKGRARATTVYQKGNSLTVVDTIQKDAEEICSWEHGSTGQNKRQEQ